MKVHVYDYGTTAEEQGSSEGSYVERVKEEEKVKKENRK